MTTEMLDVPSEDLPILRLISLSLGGLGLLLAILDFTGTSRALERSIDEARSLLGQWLERNSAKRLLNFYASVNLGKFIRNAYWYAVPFAFIGALFVAAVGPSESREVDFFAALVALKFVIYLLQALAFFLIYIVPIISLWSLTIAYKLAHLLNKPRAGTLGTIGLFTAIIGFGLELYSATKGT